MARSLIERLKKRLKDNVLEFLETEPRADTPPLHSIPPAELIYRLKLRLGAIEAERYRLKQSIGEPSNAHELEAQAGAALDAGDDRLAREILRLKVDRTSTQAEATVRIQDLDEEAEDLQALISLVAEDEEIGASLEERLAKYQSVLKAAAQEQAKDA